MGGFVGGRVDWNSRRSFLPSVCVFNCLKLSLETKLTSISLSSIILQDQLGKHTIHVRGTYAPVNRWKATSAACGSKNLAKAFLRCKESEDERQQRRICDGPSGFSIRLIFIKSNFLDLSEWRQQVFELFISDPLEKRGVRDRSTSATARNAPKSDFQYKAPFLLHVQVRFEQKKS